MRIPIQRGPGSKPIMLSEQKHLQDQMLAISRGIEYSDGTSNACLSLIDVGDQVGINYLYRDEQGVKGIVLLCSWGRAHEGLDMFRQSAIQSESLDIILSLDELADEVRRRNRELVENN